MAQQAIEKYLKGILLYSRKPTKGFGHDIFKAYSEAKQIPAIGLILSSEVEQLIDHLNAQGPNRYFEWNLQLKGNELLLLDKCVWHLRARCVALNTHAGIGGIQFWTSDQHFQKLRECKTAKDRQKIQIPFGKLEALLAGKSKARESLVWKNFYFGRNCKRVINWKRGTRFSSPTHVCHPALFVALDKSVQFSPQVRKHFLSLAVQGNAALTRQH